MILELAVRAAHMLAAAVWVGGMLTFSLATAPALRGSLDPGARAAAMRAVTRRLSRAGWAALALLAASGLWTSRGLWADPAALPRAFYGRLFLFKMSLVAVMVTLSALHDLVWGPRALALEPGSPDYVSRVRRLAFWARLNAAVTVGIVVSASALRLNPF